MNDYERLYNALQEATGWDHAKMRETIKLAQQWHNPLNYDDGQPIKDQYGWDLLFTDALRKEGYGNRFYFKFHHEDMCDADIVMAAFRHCTNWDGYCKVWMKYAPKGLKNKAIYLLAISEMSLRGFNFEAEKIDEFRKAGHEVRVSSPKEDLQGVDVWVDGKPVQIKSPATAAAMKRKEEM